MRTFLKLVLLGPIVVVAVLLAVANRGAVRIVLDPFASDTAAGIDVPLFALLLGFLTLGVVLGGVGAWLSQHRHRKAARSFRREAERQRAEADRLRTELAGRSDGPASAAGALVPRRAA